MRKWLYQPRQSVKRQPMPWLKPPTAASLIFSAHTTLAALLALVIAQMLELHHPWWAAMTVWLVAQPTRQLMIGRMTARLIGTAVGALAGGILLAIFFDHPYWLMLALAGWVALCAGVGNLFRHFRNYACVLAGYTAAIVALFGLQDRTLDVDLALGRFYCTVIGVLASAFFAWAFTVSSAAQQTLDNRIDDWVLASVRYSLHCARGATSQGRQLLNTLLQEAAEFDLSLDQIAAGSRAMSRRARQVRATLAAVLELLVWATHLGKVGELNRSLELPQIPPGAPAIAAVQAVISQIQDEPLAAGLSAKLEHVAFTLQGPESAAPRTRQMLGQHDWRGACLAAARPLVALLIATTLWWAFAWADGPMMVMTAVLFASLFSSHSHADAALKDVLVGSCVGAALGLTCRFWWLPHVASAWQLALAIAPFLLVGAWLMARPSTAKLAIDLNMTFLLIAQPSLSTDTSFEHSLLQMVAILGGVLIALLTYRWWVPSSAGTERKRLASRIAHLTLKISNERNAATRSRLYGQITVLLVRLITLEKYASALLLSAFECMAMAQRVAERRAEKFPLSVADQHGVTRAVARLQNTTIPGAECLESTENTHV